jgi:hypothetical protein
VLRIMQFHNLSGNCRLQGIVAVRQIGKRVLLTGQTAHGPRRLPGVPQQISGCQHDHLACFCSGGQSLSFLDWRMGIGNLEIREWELI